MGKVCGRGSGICSCEQKARTESGNTTCTQEVRAQGWNGRMCERTVVGKYAAGVCTKGLRSSMAGECVACGSSASLVCERASLLPAEARESRVEVLQPHRVGPPKVLVVLQSTRCAGCQQPPSLLLQSRSWWSCCVHRH